MRFLWVSQPFFGLWHPVVNTDFVLWLKTILIVLNYKFLLHCMACLNNKLEKAWKVETFYQKIGV